MKERYPIDRDGEDKSVDSMAQQLRENSGGNRLNRAPTYGEVSQAMKAEALDKIIGQQQKTLSRVSTTGRTDLTDLAAVQATTNRYLEACKKSSVIPTVSGLSAALGYSRQWITEQARRPGEVGQYLSALFSAFSAVLEQMGLLRMTSEAVSIFLLKNGAVGLSDRYDIAHDQPTDNTDDELGGDALQAILARYSDGTEEGESE